MKGICFGIFYSITLVVSAQDLTQNYRKPILNSPNSISLFQTSSTNGILASGMINADRLGIFKDATSSEEYLTVLPGGNIGIRTTNPASTLDVVGAFEFNVSLKYDGAFVAHNTDGNEFRAILAGGKTVEDLCANGNNYHSYPGSVAMVVGNGGEILLLNGNVGSGTISTDAGLTVKGQIHTQEVRVDLDGAVAPDYVFKEGYDLKSLKEVHEYIDGKGHLPNIPLASEMRKRGCF